MTIEAAVIQGVFQRLDRIGDALERIAGACDRATAPDPDASAPGCVHPEDARVQFGGMGESDGFQCKACGVFVEPVKLHA